MEFQFTSFQNSHNMALGLAVVFRSFSLVYRPISLQQSTPLVFSPGFTKESCSTLLYSGLVLIIKIYPIFPWHKHS